MKTKERLNINLDKELKEETGKILNELGLDYTTAITMYFKQIVNKKRIPFEISTKKYYSVEEIFGENWRDQVAELEDEWE
ncbi:type II toxin-antitoxin system RelB/DinJ family antitoxin [Enterococcus sp. AZ072]|uniref:type II toxin-antitoxin system RelB/DinJ family antitoxin n=1 Tax=unclassified Enterococcus TaxID=2608891 RepID=UPI003D2B32BE